MIQEEVTVSIIIPVYNVEKYILKNLESINSQVFHSFELILVDDGSPDNSIAIATEYLSKTKLNYCIIQQENKGLPAARNAGIRKACGRYLCFVDSDDILAPLYLAHLVDALKANRVPFAFCDFEPTTESNRSGGVVKSKDPLLVAQKDIQRQFLYRKAKIHCCAIIIEKEFLEKNDLYFNEVLRFGEDVEFLWRVLSLVEMVAYSPNPDYKYLIRANSLMTAQKTDKLSVFFVEFSKTIDCIPSIDAEMKEKIKERVFLGIYHSFARNSTYETFEEFIYSSLYKRKIGGCILRDIKSEMLKRVFLFSPHCFWMISKKL